MPKFISEMIYYQISCRNADADCIDDQTLKGVDVAIYQQAAINRLKANFQSVEFSERAEILLFTRENVALTLTRLLRLSNISLSKIPPARDIPLTGNWP